MSAPTRGELAALISLGEELRWATDLNRLASTFETFAWDDWRQQADGTWRSPGGRVLTDLTYQRLRATGGPEPKPTRLGRAADAVTSATRATAQAAARTKLGRAAVVADRGAGKVVGVAAGKALAWKQKQAGRVQAIATQGQLGKVLAWAAGTDVGRRTVRELERRAERVERTVKEMGTDGLVTAKVRGAKRLLGYVYGKFLANRRRYGLVPAVAIEAAVIGLTRVLPKVASAAGGLAAATAGSAGGPVGAIAAGVGGWAATDGLLGWAGRQMFGRLAPALVRAAAESAAGWIARRAGGPSEVRVRRAQQVKMEAARAAMPLPDVLPAVPRMAFAESSGPTLDDVVGEVARRLQELGLEVPPSGELMRTLEAVFEALANGAAGS